MAAPAQRGRTTIAVLAALAMAACTPRDLDKRDAGAGTVIIGSRADAGLDIVGARISEDEWRAMRSPRTGAHAVDDRSSNLCQPVAIGQDYAVQPGIDCPLLPDYDNPVYACSIAPFCTRHDECQEQPHGSCRGTPSSRCTYPGMTRKLCTTDAECAAVPDGFCYPYPNTVTTCYPTGTCELPGQRFCAYPIHPPCLTDADCTLAPDGRCAKLIVQARCEYQPCLIDADCETGTRCLCGTSGNTCVPADCATDGDCVPGHACLLLSNCVAHGYHCSTVLDTCHSDPECAPGQFCMFRNDRWGCEPTLCHDPA